MIANAQEALTCCPNVDHSYDPMTRVCSNRTSEINLEWKILNVLQSTAGTLTCGKYRVLVDYEIVLTYAMEKNILETIDRNRDRFINASPVDCDNSECDEINGTHISPLEITDYDMYPEFQTNTSVDMVMRIVSARIFNSPSGADAGAVASFLPGGMLGIGPESHARGDFCLNVRDQTESTVRLTARVCQHADRWCQGKKRTCFRKCCPDGEIMVERALLPQDKRNRTRKKNTCHPHPEGFAISKLLRNLHGVHNRALPTTEQGWPFPLGIYNGEVCKRGKYKLYPEVNKYDKWELKEDGTLYINHIKYVGPVSFTHDSYCMETILSRGKDEMTNHDIYAYLCFPDQNQGGGILDTTSRIVYGVSILISCIFIVATLVAYAILPSLRNLHGVTLVSHAICLLAAFLALAIAKFTEEALQLSLGCKVLGFSILFAFLAAYSWLSVMCFDIWWTFGQGKMRAKSGTRGMSSKSGGALQGNLHKFILYSIYAWTLPLVITLITALLDIYGGSFFFYLGFEEDFLPNMGEIKCWFPDDRKWAVIIYFVGPSSILLVANMIMYTLTALRCWKIKAEIQRMQYNDKEDSGKGGDRMIKFGKKWWSQTYKEDKERFFMNLKLFAAMGINWALEIISWWLSRGEDSKHKGILPKAIWCVSDVLNCFHGVFVFIVFVGKKKILVQLWKKVRDLSRCCPLVLVRDEEQNSSQRGHQSYNTSSFQDIHACNEGKTYNFNDDDGRKMGRIRRWLTNRFFHSRRKKHSRHYCHSMGKESTTSTSISADICHGNVSNVP
ncbi:probable G-protein coupled receptor Mth-like 2 isoform X2 [Ischnura elegans]|uniref:probable G-protein coupled receptor Mth-like 2 isoform X2 n=1 Tax=Ischnura elegans TaxID=197161 RepID=UPI001ED8B6BD|nr:probable G-protein coupled receptor Mth-like 2 isoform X2 [Ischnura elegans]